MSDELNALQTKVWENTHEAVYIYCFVLHLNLVLRKNCSKIKSVMS